MSQPSDQPSQSQERRKKNEEDFKAFNVSSRVAMEEVMDEESKWSLPVGMVCECSNPNCNEKIELTVAERRRIRRDPDDFVIVPGHEDEEIEKVVERYSDYCLVKKFEKL